MSPDQRFLVIGIVNCKIVGVSQTFSMAAQNPHAAGMEGADPDPLDPYPTILSDTLTHFSGGLVRKGDRHNIPRIDAFVPD